MVVDEFQASVSGAHLEDYLTTARSAEVGVVLATQSFQTVIARFGQDLAKSIFGLPATVIACTNDCDTTNQFTATRGGKHWIQVPTTSKSTSFGGMFSTSVKTTMSKGRSSTEQERYIVDPSEFKTLKCAGPRRPYARSIVLRDGYVYSVDWYRDGTSPRRPGHRKRQVKQLAMAGVLLTAVHYVPQTDTGQTVPWRTRS